MQDVVIIGGGPAGLQSAIFTASEGLKTTLFEGNHLGGQIHDTPKLENYAGQSSKGISGPEFTATMKSQCDAFGVKFVKKNVTTCKRQSDGTWIVNGVKARSVILASGYRYRIPECSDIQKYLASGQAFIGPFRCMSVKKGLTYCVVGGGNSAGQAIMSLSEHAQRVIVLTRSNVGMSQYLVDRIMGQSNIEIETDILPVRMTAGNMECDNGLQYPADHYFFCIGGIPNSEMVEGQVKKDETGHVIVNEQLEAAPGLFAVGDVRKGIRRHSVAASIGDAAAATAYVHAYLRSDKAPRVS